MKCPELTSKKSKRADGGEPRRQYAALPWRLVGEGVEILLASSRDTRRWVIPKGWPMKGCEPYMTAAIEAREEAGLTGKIEKNKDRLVPLPKAPQERRGHPLPRRRVPDAGDASG